jgi:putative DNA primase/helicase
MSKNRIFKFDEVESYWDDFIYEAESEKAKAFSDSDVAEALTLNDYTDIICNAINNSAEKISEDDMMVSRKGEGKLEESDIADYGPYDGEENDMHLFEQLTKGLAEKAKPSKPEKAPELDFMDTEDLGEYAKEPKPASSIFPIPKAKVKEKDLSLDEMENAILQKVPLIRHDGGLYFYNGRTYIALKSDMDLIELIRSENISASCFQTHSVRVFNDLYAYLRADPKLKLYDYEERVRKCRNYVVLNNGVLNAKKLELKPFGKKWLTFHSVNASWVENPNPRRFLKFLNDAAMGDSSIVRLTLEMIGYLLSSLNTAKVFFVIGTAGNSGKSTLASLIKYLLGDEFVMAVSPNNLSDRFSLGDSRGKTVDLAMDIPKGKLNAAAVSRIKSITGNDSIVIEAKYMRPESTVSNLRFLFGTNYPITLPREDDEDAFWKRMIIIPFMRVTPPNEIEVDLLDQLIAEKDDIVSLCLRHLHTVIRNNYTFSPCQRSEAMKKSWRRAEFSTASVYYFWNSCVEVTGEPKDTVYSSSLYGEYVKYCSENELDAVQYIEFLGWIEKNTDPEMCVKKRIHRTNANPLSGFAGIKIRK